MDKLKESSVLNSLFFNLLGFNTPVVYVENNMRDDVDFLQKEVKVSLSDQFETTVKPFQFLITKIREFYDFDMFNPFISAYFKKIVVLKESVSSIEELYIHLQEDIEIFKELNKIKHYLRQNNSDIYISHTNLFRLESVEKSDFQDYNFDSKYISEFLIDVSRTSNVYLHFWNKNKNALSKHLFDWINYAKKSPLIQEQEYNEFSKCYWDDLFVFNSKSIPNEDVEEILTCGKIVNIIRVLFEIEIVTNTDNPFDSGFLSNKNIEIIKYNRIVSYNDFFLRPIDYDKFTIRGRRYDLEMRFAALYSEKIEREINILYDVLFLRSYLLYKDIFDQITNSEFMDQKKFRELIKGFSNSNLYSFNSQVSSLSVYLLKLLNCQNKTPTDELFKNPIEGLAVDFHPKYLRYFISPKIFTELGIINRFLVNIFFVSQKLEDYLLNDTSVKSFSKLVYLLLNQIKSTEITRINFTDILEFQPKLKLQIKKLLNSYYLTNSEIFQEWAKLFSISFQYIELKESNQVVNEEEYYNKAMHIIKDIDILIEKYGDDNFIDFLKK
ncbi:hypothetical protein HERIO_224 [Hepatospora eriocheir]|uniref:Uncharacterized protein n=1 Tax=Hepatospora eriocheir TaxID=1081669 RepID=A0A1X0QDN2_9MICR|nr:hypothetical protein HERIO_224 [Hepatospora eriocheir]